MPNHTVTSPDDPRIRPFRDLPNRTPPDDCRHYVVEGRVLVNRLLAMGPPPLALLVEDGLAPQFAARVADSVDVYVADRELLRQIVGFRFHRGVLALAPRPANPVLSLLAESSHPNPTIVACTGILDPENLGSILRTSASLGVSGVLVGNPTADPFGRRVVRVSMGAVFTLPIRRVEDLRSELEELRHGLGFETAASVLDESAESLASAVRPPRFALVLGSEGDGLPPSIIGACNRRITIPMAEGVDSLNVAVAAGIMLFQFRPR